MGWAWSRSLREARPHARIVVVTDADSFATVVLALRAGADGFVPKPVDEGELIDALLDRAPPLPPVPQTALGPAPHLLGACHARLRAVRPQHDQGGAAAGHAPPLAAALLEQAGTAAAGHDDHADDERLLPAHLAGAPAPATLGNLFDR